MFQSLKGFLVKKHKNTPVHLYFHENQFSYPVSGKDPDGNTERLEHYQFIQLKSFLSAEKVYFNSNYNRETFLDGAKKLLNKLPEDNSEFLANLKIKNTFIWPLQGPGTKRKN